MTDSSTFTRTKTSGSGSGSGSGSRSGSSSSSGTRHCTKTRPKVDALLPVCPHGKGNITHNNNTYCPVFRRYSSWLNKNKLIKVQGTNTNRTNSGKFVCSTLESSKPAVQHLQAVAEAVCPTHRACPLSINGQTPTKQTTLSWEVFPTRM